jgi:hypothetical protein
LNFEANIEYEKEKYYYLTCWDNLVFDDRIVIYRYYKRVIILLMLLSTFLNAFLAIDRTRPKNELFNSLEIVSDYLELLFFFEMLLNFFKNSSGLHDHQKIHKNFHKVSTRYINNEFIWDFLPLLPLHHLKLPRNYNKLFYLIKLLRLK